MVAMNVWPTDAADGAVTSEARWRKMGRAWANTGVVAGQGGNMAPTLAFPNLTIKAGACWVDGHYCELAGDSVLAVTANGIAVVRFDPAANTADLVYRDAVSVPAQSPTGTYEMVVASMAGSVLTDRRILLPAANEITNVLAPAGFGTGPYAGGWAPANLASPIQIRSGHVALSTTGFGDATIAFVTPFPNGIISCQITPAQTSSDVFWFPVIVGSNIATCHFYACAPSGYPFAGNHPPGLANVWTIGGTIVLDYLAIGV